jgi:hypothetical protein
VQRLNSTFWGERGGRYKPDRCDNPPTSQSQRLALLFPAPRERSGRLPHMFPCSTVLQRRRQEPRASLPPPRVPGRLYLSLLCLVIGGKSPGCFAGCAILQETPLFLPASACPRLKLLVRFVCLSSTFLYLPLSPHSASHSFIHSLRRCCNASAPCFDCRRVHRAGNCPTKSLPGLQLWRDPVR